MVLLDPRQQKDPVVGRERERDDEQQDRLRRLEGALARVAEEPLEAPVLEDQDEQAEGGAEGEQVHHERLERQHDRAGYEEEQNEGGRSEDRERDRQVRLEARLLVEEAGRGASDEHRTRGLLGADGAREPLRRP